MSHYARKKQTVEVEVETVTFKHSELVDMARNFTVNKHGEAWRRAKVDIYTGTEVSPEIEIVFTLLPKVPETGPVVATAPKQRGRK